MKKSRGTHRLLVVVLTVLGILAILTPQTASAQSAADSFPDRAITLMVPFAAGGPVDLIARAAAQALSEEIGKPVIVENRVGAGGAVACVAVAHAPADGYTLLAVDVSFVVVPLFQPDAGYDPVKDFRMVGLTSRSTLALAIAPNSDVNDLDGFIESARKLGRGVAVAHAGIGSTPFMAAVAFSQAAKIDPLMVSYRGMTPALNDLIANRVNAGFVGPASVVGLAQDKKVKVLAVMGKQRLSSEPDVPTFAERGVMISGFEQGTWYGIAAPAGTPEAIIGKLNAALDRALQKKDVSARLNPSDIVISTSNPGEFDAFVRSQADHWKEVVAKVGPGPQQ